MSLSENGNGMVMPVGPMYGNGSNGSWFGDGGLFWIIILFLFAWMGNGWGNGYGNQAPAVAVNNDIQRGFDQQAIMGELNGVSAALTNGFASAEISRCNAQANSLQAMNNIASSLQQCCCDNRERNYYGNYGMNSYAQPRSTVTGRFTSRGMNPYSMRDYAYGENAYGYDMNRSGHSTKDRMVSRLEDMMGEAKNEYEAQMIRNTIDYIQAGR